MWKKYNPNPLGKSVGDCAVRAVSKVLNKPWEETYMALCTQGLLMADMPNSDVVWGMYLRDHGFRRHVIPDTCPDCYTIADFAEDHPDGTYAVGTGSHVVAVTDGGNYFDSWDSGSEVPIFYWRKDDGI